MSAGGPVRKPSNSRDSAVAAMRSTINDFRTQSGSWQHEVEKLFDEFESLTINTSLQAAAAGEQQRAFAKQQFAELAKQQDELAQQQQSAKSEIVMLRKLVEQQTELLTALLSTPARG